MSVVAVMALAILAAAPERPPDFDTEVLPVLTKAGCNAGACHGAAAGRGGFHLSLFGGDPAADYEAIVHSLEGRRVNLAEPQQSLLLAKPTGYLEHGGDVVLDEEGAGAERLLAWIQSGAPRGRPRQLTNLEITPQRYLGGELSAEVPLRVFAQFDGGPAEEVTPWTVFVSEDPAAVEIDHRSVARIKRRGQHVVVARFLDRVVPLQFNVPYSDDPVELASEPRAGFIDEEVLRVLSELRLPVSPPASDAAWLRRVSLDLTGRLPEPDVVDSFVAEASQDKRRRLVDDLLSSDAFTEYWTLRLARLLRMRSLPNDTEGLRAYAGWLREAIDRGTGLDAMAHQLLTATGDSHAVGPSNFARMVPDARGHAELVSQVFLGMRLECANCHDHPLDRWTQDDYHGLAAVFARLDRGRTVRVLPRGAVTNLRTGEPAVPRIPGHRDLEAEGDPREALAQWITSEPNRHLARATVNRLWRAMMGRGLVEPPDDLRQTNPATHPELLDQLADDFVAHGYSLRHTLRQIALSHTYARSATVLPENAVDDRFYSHAYRRPLGPEVLADAIADVTGIANEYAGPTGAMRAVGLIDPRSPAPSLDLLGRCTPGEGCAEEGGGGGGLSAQLHFLNGELINGKLAEDGGRLQRRIASGRSDAEIVDEFYVRALGRPPRPAELDAWCQRLTAESSVERRQRLEDFVWSLLNSRQFRENY